MAEISGAARHPEVPARVPFGRTPNSRGLSATIPACPNQRRTFGPGIRRMPPLPFFSTRPCR